jgi:hypothetical protein
VPCRQPPWYRSEIAFCIQGKILKECFFFPQYNKVILQIKEGDHDGDEPEQFTQNGNPDKNEQIAAIKRISYQGVRATHDERPALPFSGGTGKAPYVTQGPEAKTLPTGYEKEAAAPYHEITFPFPPKAKQHKKEQGYRGIAPHLEQPLSPDDKLRFHVIFHKSSLPPL